MPFHRIDLICSPNEKLDSSFSFHAQTRWYFRVAAFSLVEILLVIAIVGVLAAFAVPALSSIGGARGSIDAAYKISQSIELARSEAVARRTFVWLGFENANKFGNRNLILGSVYSRDGSTSTTLANLQPLFRPIVMEKVGLVSSVETGANTDQYSDAVSLDKNQSGIAFSSGSQNFILKTITFTPSGEAMLSGLPTSTTPFENKILIGLRGFRGTTESPNNDVAIVVDGSTGMPTIYRKQ